MDFPKELCCIIGVYSTVPTDLSMTLPRHIDARPELPCRRCAVWVVVLVAMMLSACASVRPVKVVPPALNSPDAVVQIADVDVLAVSPEMDAFLERYILRYQNLDTRLRLLTLAVVISGVLGFEYDDTSTLTAAETFSRRSGNCISHANMLIALARRAGLDARYQEVVIEPEWTSRDDTVLINKHINVVLASPQNSYHVDVSGREVRPDSRRRILSDRDGKAMYFNNLGAVALIENDLPMAYGYMLKAIESSPQVADSWINLGVVFSRNKQFNEAELSLKTALQIDTNEYSAMNNLYGIYLHLKKFDEAEELKRRVDNYRRKNPYYLLMLSNEALDQSRFEDSTSLLKRAIKLKEDDHQLHFAMAKAQYLSGNTVAAESSLRRARELAPDDKIAEYSMSLDELMGHE